jgi:hypothetical protein
MMKKDSSGSAAADYRRASACIPGNDCVEVWVRSDGIWVRGSRDSQGVELRLSRSSWTRFLAWQLHAQ